MLKNLLGPCVLLVLISMNDASAATVQGQSAAGQPPKGIATASVLTALDLSPAVFIENKGQWDSSIRYGFDGKGVRVSFTDAGLVFQMLKSEGAEPRPAVRIPSDEVSRPSFTRVVFAATFVGAKTVRPVGLEPSSATMNFYRGNDKSKWQSGVPTYSKVMYKGLYEGVDLYTWGKRLGLKYEFHVAPGASWENVVIRYDGIDSLSLDDSGALHVRTALGEMVDKGPVCYQETAGGRKKIPSRFRLIDAKSYGFQLIGEYDRSLPLVLDPDIGWASYLGGIGEDSGNAITIDASGLVWVTGFTASSDFPVPGGFDAGHSGTYDVFVAKVAPSGGLAWASFLGGGNADYGSAIAVDASRNAWVTGYTRSSDFPMLGAFDNSLGGTNDAFVARITPSGALAWSSYLGGGGDDFGNAIDVDASGNAWVVGRTQSTDFPTPGGFDVALGAPEDAFVAKITQAGTLLWASYLGGAASDGGQAIAMDASGNAWVAGYTRSSDFPTPGGFDTSLGGFADAFVAKITKAGALVWATYLGGSSDDYCYGIAFDASGDAWLTGYTLSSDFPTPGGFDTSIGAGDCFVARITNAGDLAWGSFLGGYTADSGSAIAIDPSGDAWVTGNTRSSDFPRPHGFDTSIGGAQDGFVARITPAGTLASASFLGGSGEDVGRAIAIDAAGNAWVSGETGSSDFPTPHGFDTSYGGGYDAFVVAILPPDADWLAIADWLKIDKLQLALPPSGGSDSLVLQASFNMWFTSSLPQTVTLTVDGWSMAIDASLWKRSGKSNTYTFKQDNVSGKIAYWVGGTTKCLFTFKASKQTLQGSLPNLPDLPVRLRFGSHFDKTLTANVTLKNNVAKLASVGPPGFFVDKLAMTRNPRQSARDAVKLSGRLFLDSDLDLASDAVSMEIGPYEFTIPAGVMAAAKNGVIVYSEPTANGKLTFRLNLKTHALVVTATGIDLSSLVPEAHVDLTITNHAGADWAYGLFLSANRSGTAYKY